MDENNKSNNPECVFWYSKAAEQGHPKAQLALGHIYEYGHGDQKDEQKAMMWYRKSANQFEALAYFQLGAMLADGRGGEKNEVEAAQWFLRAADIGGWMDAQFNFGFMLATGRGVEKNEIEAIKWLAKAAEYEKIFGRDQLINMLTKDRCLTRSEVEKIMDWYQMACRFDKAKPVAS